MKRVRRWDCVDTVSVAGTTQLRSRHTCDFVVDIVRLQTVSEPIIFNIITIINIHLTLWRPLLTYGYLYEASCAKPDYKPSFVIFWHPGTLTLRAERQSGRMSKITNDGLTRSGTYRMRYSCTNYQYGNSGRQRVNVPQLTGILRKKDEF